MSDGVRADEAYILDQAMQAARRLLGPDADADVAAVNGLARELAWIFCARGQTICEQGQPSDALFFLIRGRALAVYQDEATGLSQIVGEIGRGETIGEMGILTGEARSVTVVCSRDSELLRLDRATFERLVVEHPRILLSVSQTVIERLRRRNVTHRRASTATPVALAVLPAGGDDGRPLAPFAEALATALGRYGPSCHVSAAHLPAELSDAMAQDAADPRVVGWLNDLEQAHRFVVLQAEAEPSPWTERCIRQADRRLLVARTETSPTLGRLEQQTEGLSTGVAATRQDLVLLHSDRGSLPTGTVRWLEQRGTRIDRHHHVHLGAPATVERLARLLAGRAVGLALGGGGARGFAHIGIVRALREAGVPIDAIAGTSMGSIIGAECALGWTDAEMRARNHEAFIERHPLLDYTLPLVAMLSGRGVTRMLRGLFDDVQIEDLWLTYAAVASNLTDGTVLAGSRGLLRKYIRASCSVPGILPPVSDNGQLLVDGGVLNNIPADIVRDVVGPGVVIAVNVNPSEGLRASDELGDVLEGWSIAWRRVNPFRKSLAIPNIHDMLERMTMLASIQQAAGVVQATADLYLHPPTDMVRFLDWHAMDAHIERGYEYARPLVAAWAEQSGYAGTAPWSTG